MKRNLKVNIPPIKALQGRTAESDNGFTTPLPDRIYQSILKESHIGFVYIDMDGRFLEFNESYRRMLGYPAGELKTMNYHDITPAQWHGPENEMLQNVLTTGESFTYEKEYRRKDGTIFPIELQAFVFRGTDGNPTGMWAFVRDITERKQAQKRARESDMRYQLLLENIDLGISLVSSDYRIHYMNTSNSRLFHKDKNLFIGKECFRELEKRDQVCPHCPGTVAMQERRRAVAEATGVRDDGTRFEVRMIAYPTYDSEGRLNGFVKIVEDLSSRRRQEELLQESERKYKQLFEILQEGIWVIDSGANTTLVNPRMAQILGYDQQEMLGRSFFSFVAREERDTARKHFKRRQEGIAEQHDYEFIRKDGNRLHASLAATPILDARGNFQGALAGVMDITDRKKIEDELRNSEEKYRVLVENAIEFICIVQDGVIKFANRGEVLGYARQELMARPFTEFIHPQERALVLDRNLRRQKGADLPIQYSFRALHSSGETRWVELNSVLVQWEGRPATLNFLSDITARRAAEEALKMSEEKFSKSFENSPMIMILTEIKDGVILDVNRKFCEVTGYEKEEVIGRTSLELGWMSQELRNHLISLGRSGPVAGAEAEFTVKDRRKILVDYHGMVITIGGQKRFLSYLLDMTEHKRAEEEHRLLQERLERAERMESLGVLAGGVAHDLNNVLGVLVGYSSLLLNTVDKKSPMHGPIENMFKSGERATAIVQDLLTLARRGVQNKKIIDLNKAIDEYLRSPELSGVKSFHPNLRVRTELGAGLLRISGSPVHVQKTLMNLISNAAEAMPQGGEVLIRTANCYLERPVSGYDHVVAGEYVLLSVSDQGEGISGEDMRHIFEPFYTKKKMGRSGTGLGLAVVWGTVKDLNGYVDVESEIGKGTTFKLYLPVTREDILKEEAAVSEASYRGRGERVLVVDDVVQQRELASLMLTRLGYSVETAESGEAAVAYLTDHEADIVVLDMIMDPGIDGLETYRRILKIRPGQKAVIVSGFAETDRVREAQALGAGEYLRKPYILEQIGTVIRRELDRKIPVNR